MGNLRRSVGFVASLGNTRIKSILWPEGTLALLLGLSSSSVAIKYLDLPLRLEAASDALRVLSSLLGMVLAGLMLVITISNDDYLKLLNRTSDGVLGFYRPFVLAIGIQILTILSLIAYRAMATDVTHSIEGWSFRLITVMFVFSLLDIVALARNLLMHAVTRAKQSDLTESPDDVVAQRRESSSGSTVSGAMRPWRRKAARS